MLDGGGGVQMKIRRTWSFGRAFAVQYDDLKFTRRECRWLTMAFCSPLLSLFFMLTEPRIQGYRFSKRICMSDFTPRSRYCSRKQVVCGARRMEAKAHSLYLKSSMKKLPRYMRVIITKKCGHMPANRHAEMDTTATPFHAG